MQNWYERVMHEYTKQERLAILYGLPPSMTVKCWNCGDEVTIYANDEDFGCLCGVESVFIELKGE